MKTQTIKPGPTWEQLTEQQRSSVCGLFETLERIAKRLAMAKRQVTNALDRSSAPSSL